MKKKGLGIAYIVYRILKVVNLTDPEKRVQLALMVDIKFIYLHGPACCVKGIIAEQCWHAIDHTFHVSMWRPFLARKVNGNLRNHRHGVSCVVPRRMHVIKRWRNVTFNATLKEIEIEKWDEVKIHFDRSDNDKVWSKQTGK